VAERSHRLDQRLGDLLCRLLDAEFEAGLHVVIAVLAEEGLRRREVGEDLLGNHEDDRPRVGFSQTAAQALPLGHGVM